MARTSPISLTVSVADLARAELAIRRLEKRRTGRYSFDAWIDYAQNQWRTLITGGAK